MEYIHRLPFIVGFFMAIVVGIINYKLGVEQQETFTRMAISLILFFAAGLVLRNLLSSLSEELEKRKKELEEQELQGMQQHNENLNDAGTGAEAGTFSQPGIDYRVEDEFTPLKVSEILSSSLEK